MSLTKCRTLFNEEKWVPTESLIQRPSVYGFAIHDNRLLVVKTVHTGKYVLPGGGIEKGETVEAALIREFREETGIDIRVGRFLHFEGDFFYYDPLEMALQGYLFFYQCFPQSFQLHLAPETAQEEGLEMPLWVEIDHLQSHDFQSHGELMLQRIASLR
jgi:8-oxo-dGTP pyrophosphatase MutT (NUDIX family)